MDLGTIAKELYGLPPREFTAARDAKSREAREAGDRELASSIKQLRKPSASAWMANMLARSQPVEIEGLIVLGEGLRSVRNLDGEQMRRATKEKASAVSKLLRQAKAIAKRAGEPVSSAAEQDLEATLDAAFSDPKSAASLRDGRLVNALHYSGLGFTSGVMTKAATAGPGPRGRGTRTDATTANAARRALEQATHEAEQADADVARAHQAIVAAEADLKRLRAACDVAARKATKAHQKVSVAKKRAGHWKGTPAS